MEKHPTQKPKSCAHCGQPFIPDPRVPAHRFCHRPECRRASRRLSQAKWLNQPENRDYHHGPEQVERNRVWRKAHPGYRAEQRRRQKLRHRLRRVLSSDLVAALISCGLQDLNDSQLALVFGLIRRVCHVGLQDSMATTLRRLMFEGYALLRTSEFD